MASRRDPLERYKQGDVAASEPALCLHKAARSASCALAAEWMGKMLIAEGGRAKDRMEGERSFRQAAVAKDGNDKASVPHSIVRNTGCFVETI
jgi:hypothetical protein